MPPEQIWRMKQSKKSAKTGELYLYGPIASERSWFSDNITPKQFKKDLDALGNIDVLDVYINSPGGEVFAGQAIHSMLKRHPAHVNVYVDGLAASIASVVAMSADTLYMPRNAMLMIHNAWSRMQGNANDFRKMADDLDKISSSAIAAYEDKSNLSREEIVAIMDAETWLTAEECLAMGFADKITPAREIAADITDGIFNFSGQSMPLDKMINAKELLAKLPNAINMVPRIDNTPKGGVKPMKFAEILASLSQEQQEVVNAELSVNGTVITTLEAALATAKTELVTAQTALAAATPVTALTDEAFLASLPEEVRARYVADQAAAKEVMVAAQTIQAEAKLASFVAKAKSFDRIPVKAEDFGKVLMAVSDAVPEAFAQIESLLGAVNAAMDSNLIFKNLGSASDTPTGTALELLNAKAQEIAKRDGITKEAGFAKACRENTGMYDAYQKELKGSE